MIGFVGLKPTSLESSEWHIRNGGLMSQTEHRSSSLAPVQFPFKAFGLGVAVPQKDVHVPHFQ